MEVPKARGPGRSGPRRRTGCLTCRARKVRCDETKPSCSNCDRLRLHCTYKPPIALGTGGPWSAVPRPPRNSYKTVLDDTVSQIGPVPVLEPASTAAVVEASSHRSSDINFFTTVLRSDEQYPSLAASAAPSRRLHTDTGAYDPPLEDSFSMVGFMGGITSELEQKHLDLTNGLAEFASSHDAHSQQASLVGTVAPMSEGGQHLDERRSMLSPDGSSSLTGRGSVSSSSEAAAARGSWPGGPGSTTYEDQLLQHFLESEAPAAIFGPVKMDWRYVRPAVLAHARDFGPLLNALYCYSDIHRAMVEGKKWRWAPTYYRAASSEVQVCLLGKVTNTMLVKIFATVFFLMLSEAISSSELCVPGTSYIHSAYLLLQRFNDHTQAWTGLGHLLVSWVLLLDVKSLIAGREGDPLTDLGEIKDHDPVVRTADQPRGTSEPEDRKVQGSDEDPFRSPNYLLYEAIVGPAFRFFVQTQQIVRRIVCIDLHHRSRGTLSDEFEVLQIAHKIGADLEALWQRRPSVIDVYDNPEALTDTLCVPIAQEVCRTFRQYIAAFLANFIYLHRVAFAIYPRTDRVNGAVDQIIHLARIESASVESGLLPVSFLWPLFVAGLEGSAEQRQWIAQEMERMADTTDTDPAVSIARHPSAEKVIVLLEEMTRRQDVSRSWADSRCVRRELFTDFFLMI